MAKQTRLNIQPGQIDELARRLFGFENGKVEKAKGYMGADLYRISTPDTTSQFYVKDCYEGKICEALGLELYNILAGKGIFQYIASQDTNQILIKEIKGSPFNEIKADTPIPISQYAKAMEIAGTLGLGDRDNAGNTLLTADDVISIDFGQLFEEDYRRMPLTELSQREIKNQKELYLQRVIARGEIARRIQSDSASIGGLVYQAKTTGTKDFERALPKYLTNPVKTMMAYLTSKVPKPESSHIYY